MAPKITTTFHKRIEKGSVLGLREFHGITAIDLMPHSIKMKSLFFVCFFFVEKFKITWKLSKFLISFIVSLFNEISKQNWKSTPIQITDSQTNWPLQNWNSSLTQNNNSLEESWHSTEFSVLSINEHKSLTTMLFCLEGTKKTSIFLWRPEFRISFETSRKKEQQSYN